MDIVLHLGAHRTASTTLQRTLGMGRAGLGQARLQYWGPKRLRAGLFRGLYSRATRPLEAQRATGRVQMRLGDAARAGHTGLIVSEENMLGTLRHVFAAECLYPGAGARVARFAEAFDGTELTIALAIRRYDLWWASAWAFLLPRGGPCPDPDLAQRLVQQPRRWRDVVAEIAAEVPQARLVVWPFEDTAPWSAEQLSAVTGRAVPLDGAAGWHNRSASVADLRRCVTDAALIRCENGRFMPFDAGQRATLMDHYAADLAWLRAGADGGAELLQTADANDVGATGLGRGSTDERRERDGSGQRSLARTG